MPLAWDGLEEFRSALRRLPESLASEAAVVVQAQAEDVGRQIVDGYSQGPTGNLKQRVIVTRDVSRFGVGAIVRSRAPHASLFEKGTGPRRTATGANRGRMPQPAIEQRMIPKVIRARQRMMTALIDIVKKAGLEVTT